MATYVMFGVYPQDSIKKISAQRTKQMRELIQKHGGRLISAYALLGEKDLLLMVEFDNVEQVMKTSVALSKILDISFSTSEAVSVEEFDRITEEPK